jgi:hypothetical protein
LSLAGLKEILSFLLSEALELLNSGEPLVKISGNQSKVSAWVCAPVDFDGRALEIGIPHPQTSG